MGKILFVCEYNACRSQMAEGLARRLLPPTVSAESAGLYPGEVNALTIEVMREIGVDLAPHRSKRLEAVAGSEFDWLVLLAEPAVEATRGIRAKKRLHWFHPDPAKTVGDRETIKAAIRRVRDELKTQIEEFFLK